MDGKERMRRIPFSGLQRASDAARRFFRLAPFGVASLLPLAGVAPLARSLRISALRSRRGQRQNRQQRGSLQYFNRLLESILDR